MPVSTPTDALDAYVRSTIIDSARQEVGDWSKATGARKSAALKSAAADAARGSDTGWWSDLIYNRDVYALADRHRVEIVRGVMAYVEATTVDTAGSFRVNEILAACTLAPRLAAWEAEREEDVTAQESTYRAAFMYGLRLAVDMHAANFAAELDSE